MYHRICIPVLLAAISCAKHATPPAQTDDESDVKSLPERGSGENSSALPDATSSPNQAEAQPQAVWWKSGPATNEGHVPAEVAAQGSSIACEWDDPFYKYFSCPGVCHYVLGKLGPVTDEPDGQVTELDSEYIVLDTRRAALTVQDYLTDVKPFTDGTRVVHALPDGPIPVQEEVHGFVDHYSRTEVPKYLGTDWTTYLSPPITAKLPAEGQLAVIGVADARNMVAKERWAVRVVLPVLADGRVDFSGLSGTNATVEAGWPADTPTEPVSPEEAKAWLQGVLAYSGVRCAPLHADQEATSEPQGAAAPNNGQ